MITHRKNKLCLAFSLLFLLSTSSFAESLFTFKQTIIAPIVGFAIGFPLVILGATSPHWWPTSWRSPDCYPGDSLGGTTDAPICFKPSGCNYTVTEYTQHGMSKDSRGNFVYSSIILGSVIQSTWMLMGLTNTLYQCIQTR